MHSKRGKKGDKGGKGLRHFSMKVCEKVQTKGVTSYNEVADELVAEFSDPRHMVSPSDSVTVSEQVLSYSDSLLSDLLRFVLWCCSVDCFQQPLMFCIVIYVLTPLTG